MNVYIVFEITQLNNFSDNYGETPNDHEEIIAVFDSYEKAERVREEYQNEADRCEFELGCDPTRYEIRDFTVY